MGERKNCQTTPRRCYDTNMNFEDEPLSNNTIAESAPSSASDRILATIINHHRSEYGWDEIGQAENAEDKNDALRTYISNLDLARRGKTEGETGQKLTPEERRMIDIMYRTEMVNTWTMNHRKNEGGNSFGILEAVKWGNSVIAYISEINRQADKPSEAQARLSSFWKTQEQIARSIADQDMREQLLDALDNNRRGILRVVAIHEALRLSLGWESKPPRNPKDDAFNKIDLVVQSLKEDEDKRRVPNNLFLVQVKERSQTGDTHAFAVSLVRPPAPGAVTSNEFETGIGNYIANKNSELKKAGNQLLNPRKILGLLCNVSAKRNAMNPVTGHPAPWFMEEIASQFRAADEILTQEQSGKKSGLTKAAI